MVPRSSVCTGQLDSEVNQKVIEMPVEMRLSRIIISEINENQVVFLQEVDGARQFPILIGIFEATSIDRRVKKIPRPRPLTHDLLVGMVDTLCGDLDPSLIDIGSPPSYTMILNSVKILPRKIIHYHCIPDTKISC